jgi:hypothetical protein
MSREVLLVGSVPLADAECVFRAIAKSLASHVRRIPDGETGPRLKWIDWQSHVFESHPMFQRKEADLPDWRIAKVESAWKSPGWYALRPDADPRRLTFGPLGYAQAARASFEIFARCKREGTVRPDTRFQVSLPTPYNVIDQRVAPGDRLAVERPYEDRLLAEIDQVCEAIPHDQLAIQWDVAHEIQNLDGARPHWFDNPETEIIARLTRLAERIPPDIELGFHLCYGDFGHRHFIEPKDTELMTRISNSLSRSVNRSIEWIHMPVPRDRTDDRYFAPFSNLRLQPQTRIFLGLIHHTDGIVGATARMKTAGRYVGEFGVATECGLGRRKPETIMPLLKLHAQIAELSF